MQELLAQAIELLPKTGEVQFDAYKASLNTAMPDKSKDVFTYLLKHNMLNKRVVVGEDHKVNVFLSRKV